MDDQSPKQREQFSAAVMLAGFFGLETTKPQLRATGCYEERHSQSDRWRRADPDYWRSSNSESAVCAWAQRRDWAGLSRGRRRTRGGARCPDRLWLVAPALRR